MAGSSLFDKYFKHSTGQNVQPQNQPQQNIMTNVIDGFNQIRNNQTNIADMLLQNGRINQQQYNDIKAMGNDYRGMAQYLMQSGLMPQNVGQMNPFVNQILSMFRR